VAWNLVSSDALPAVLDDFLFGHLPARLLNNEGLDDLPFRVVVNTNDRCFENSIVAVQQFLDFPWIEVESRRNDEVVLPPD
jgi:hypothetical protein